MRDRIREVAASALSETRERLLKGKREIDSHLGFLGNDPQNDLHFQYFLLFASGYIFQSKSNEIPELDGDRLRDIRRMTGSLHMDIEQLRNIARMMWVMVVSYHNYFCFSIKISLHFR